MPNFKLLLAVFVASAAFCSGFVVPTTSKPAETALHAVVDRRGAIQTAAAIATTIAVAPAARADDGTLKNVVVAGATGRTGRLVLERLAASKDLNVVAGVRNVDKATSSLAESSAVIREAMAEKTAGIDTAGLSFKRLDVAKDTISTMTDTLVGADALVVAVGFTSTNPFKFSQAAHEIDNVGVCNLVDAAKAAGVRKVVLVSSILTNGRAWGQEKSPGFVVTNAFGGVLDEKLVSENHLRSSGLDYTIVRPGGLKSKPPTGQLAIYGEDKLNAGEISRDLVADVCVASLSDAKATNKVLEIIEDEGKPPQAFNGLVM